MDLKAKKKMQKKTRKKGETFLQQTLAIRKVVGWLFGWQTKIKKKKNKKKKIRIKNFETFKHELTKIVQ